MLRPRDGPRSGHRLDAPDARRHAAFGDDDKEPDVAGRGDVRATAQFHTEAGDTHNTNLVAVLFAEQRHRARLDRLLGGPHLGRHRRIAADLLVDDALDAIDLVAGHVVEMHEVEPQAIWHHERPGL